MPIIIINDNVIIIMTIIIIVVVVLLVKTVVFNIAIKCPAGQAIMKWPLFWEVKGWDLF